MATEPSDVIFVITDGFPGHEFLAWSIFKGRDRSIIRTYTHVCVYVYTQMCMQRAETSSKWSQLPTEKNEKNLQLKARLNPTSYVSGSEAKISTNHLQCHLSFPVAQQVCLQENKQNDFHVISFLRTDKEETVIRSVR